MSLAQISKNILGLWPTPFYQNSLSDVQPPSNKAHWDDSMRQAIVNKIYQAKERYPEGRAVSQSWVGRTVEENGKPVHTKERCEQDGYSSYQVYDLAFAEEFEPFMDMIAAHMNNFLEQLGGARDFSILESWFTVYGSGHWVPAHNHGTCHWSGVAYLQSEPETGNVFFNDPKEPMVHMEPDTAHRGSHNVVLPAVENNILIFPGWLKHGTLPNESSRDRIIISFNINIASQNNT